MSTSSYLVFNRANFGHYLNLFSTNDLVTSLADTDYLGSIHGSNTCALPSNLLDHSGNNSTPYVHPPLVNEINLFDYHCVHHSNMPSNSYYSLLPFLYESVP